MTDSPSISPDLPGETLWVTDEEMFKRLGVPAKIGREAIHALDAMEGRRSGFPQKSKLWGDRRYWPAVRAYFDAANGLKISGFTRQEPRERSHG